MAVTRQMNSLKSADPKMLGKRIALIVGPLCTLLVLIALVVLIAPEKTVHLLYGLVASEKLQLKIGASKTEKIYADMTKALQKGFIRSGRFSLTPVVLPDLKRELELLRRGELDFAIIQGGLKLHPQGILAVARVAMEHVQVVVPMDSPIETFADLAGRRIATGLVGGGSYDVVSRLVETFDFEPRVDLISADGSELDNLLNSAKVAAAILVAPLSHELAPVMRTGRYRLVGIPQTEMLARHIDGTYVETIPLGAYGHNRMIPRSPLPTLAFNTYIVTREDVSAAPILAMLEQIYSVGVTQFMEGEWKRRSEDWGRQVHEFSLHPVAEKFYRRGDPVSADQFEIGAFFLASFLAILTGLRYTIMWWRDRKSRIRRAKVRSFIDAMVRIDAHLSQTEPQDMPEMLKQMTNIEREVEQEWLAGNINSQDMENFYERTGAKIRNVYVRMMDDRIRELNTRLEEIREGQKAILQQQGHRFEK